jgi:hypothetical protein
MITILDCFNQLIAICDRLTTTTKKPPIKPDKSIDQAIAAAEEIISIYDAVQTDIDQKIKETERVNLERRALGDKDAMPYRPRSSYYKFWSTFNPDIAIQVLNKLQESRGRLCELYGQSGARQLVDRLTDILRPFRAHESINQDRSLGLRRYKFSPYAQWLQTFSDHQLPYKTWVASGLYDNTEPTQDLDRFFAALRS